jgi:hypothetical protein
MAVRPASRIQDSLLFGRSSTVRPMTDRRREGQMRARGVGATEGRWTGAPARRIRSDQPRSTGSSRRQLRGVRCSATSIDRENKATGAGAVRLLSAWWREGVSRILSPSTKVIDRWPARFYDGSGFDEKSHTQIASGNTDCINGGFRVPHAQLRPTNRT